jgi:hypothetical protein
MQSPMHNERHSLSELIVICTIIQELGKHGLILIFWNQLQKIKTVVLMWVAMKGLQRLRFTNFETVLYLSDVTFRKTVYVSM